MTVFLDIDGVLVPANPWRAPEMLVQDFGKAWTKVMNADRFDLS